MRIIDKEKYKAAYQQSIDNPEAFWANVASHFQWIKPWETTLEWNFSEPNIQWFKGGKLNITENCLDRHIPEKGDHTAIIWEANDPKDPSQSFTYSEVLTQVCRIASALKKSGVKKGDRVCLYMPMVPELAFAVLACARIGAVHSVVFAGFSAQSLSDRIIDAEAKVILTSDGLNRGAKQQAVKRIVDEALENCPFVEKVIVLSHLGWDVPMKKGRDVWMHDFLHDGEDYIPAEPMDSEDLLFILYTSGSTGKPKGVVHTCGGYMVYAGYSFLNVFQPTEKDIFWCTADIGWVTGHTYLVYGPMLNGTTSVMFEGVPTWPHPARFWEIIDKYGVNIFYTAPTAIRSLMSFGEDPVLSYSLHSLKTLGTVGEPINEEAWRWYHTHIGKEKCPIVDTWWQTETGGIMISNLAGITEHKPTHATLPLPGIQPVLLDASGNIIEENNQEGYLCIRFPWPSMIRTTYGDHERCKQTYFSNYPDYYFTGDGAKRDENGNYRIIGRVDDVINVSGHRFGTAEIENAINTAPDVMESAVVGFPHDIKGQGIFAFVVAIQNDKNIETQIGEIQEAVTHKIGKIAKPDKIVLVSGLPKTRSGKIMRRILRKIAEGEYEQLGDTSTLLDPAVVEEILEKTRGKQAK
jgi:acetyl-CoA synthetase